MYLGGIIIQKQTKEEPLDFRTFQFPFQNLVWMCMIATTSLVVISILIASRTKLSIVDLVWASFAVYLGGNFGDNKEEKTTSKLILFLAFFSGNIVWMGYQASLTVDLSIPNSKLPFNSLETFLETDLNLYTFKKRYNNTLCLLRRDMYLYCVITILYNFQLFNRS